MQVVCVNGAPGATIRYNRPVNFAAATADYESWLAQELEIVPAGLARKHEMMRAAVFPFFRATFYRWAQLFPEVCPEFAAVLEVLAVGDLHVENFGTWRDTEGRLVWGINDFDEACRMPWTIDLVRLAASAHLAIDTEQLRIEHRDACACILSGYKESLEAGGLPWVIGARHAWLHEMVNPSLRDPIGFWKKLGALPDYPGRVPGGARRGLEKMLPRGASRPRFAQRDAGMGSLGRQRFVAIADSAGGNICREAKALAPSAWTWPGKNPTKSIRYQKALDIAVRACDPFVRVQEKWIVRRLAPDCSKIDLAMFPRQKEESKLLHAMGWETANLHLGSRRTAEILADLKQRRGHWLHKAAAKMVSATRNDWNEWQKIKPEPVNTTR
jgi:hypothetical protein